MRSQRNYCDSQIENRLMIIPRRPVGSIKKNTIKIGAHSNFIDEMRLPDPVHSLQSIEVSINFSIFHSTFSPRIQAIVQSGHNVPLSSVCGYSLTTDTVIGLLGAGALAFERMYVYH